MNKEKQRIAIAEACGMIGPFENSEEWFENGDSDGCIIVLRDATGKRVANYLNDLNAMHEAEKVLTVGQRIEYVREIGFIFTGRNDRAVPDWWLIHEADAQQRAEAFLRTIGKWEEEA